VNEISINLSKDSFRCLKTLSARTRVPQAAYFREGVEDLLEKCEEPKKRGGGNKCRKLS